ncbi:N-acetylmuramoyl-L-alanine amidase [Nonomuraea sp. NPDC050536]|uniref:N-acetylmuramoyl-L-alanine amidase n=1 Tax=Nonomuraea sp. NPDC050536 TaxID=3364366 RepID=UPI0037CA782F
MLHWLAVSLAAAAVAAPGPRQADFAAAAEQYGVPLSVLLGVSYLESRWDAHPGEPSTSGGYGPMHLIDLPTTPSVHRASHPRATPPVAGNAIAATQHTRSISPPTAVHLATAHFPAALSTSSAAARSPAALSNSAAARAHSATESRPYATPVLQRAAASPESATTDPRGSAIAASASTTHAAASQPAESRPGDAGPAARGSLPVGSHGGHVAADGPAVDSVFDDARGDDSRPMVRSAAPEEPPAAKAPEDTLRIAARLIGADPATVRRDPVTNIRAGAALLASYQREPSQDPNAWYDAVARYSGSDDSFAARAFADDVFAVMRSGAARRTDEGSLVRLAPTEGLRHPMPMRMASRAECPAGLGCEWMPAAYKRFGKKDYGNHDRMRGNRRIDYIVIHDTEGSYGGVPSMVHDPQYVSWHYTVRSRDGHVAQHVRTRDIAWHAGNWDVNSRSIGIEHEGYLAKGTWYTEALYRSSARLVRYLAGKFDIPLDRAHIIGHDNVPGTTPKTVPGMHEDPGPYWDWAHYFDLLGAPFEPAEQGSSVIIRPDYQQNQPTFTGCTKAKKPCPPRGASTVWLRKAPRDNAMLVDDVGKTLGRNATYSVYDHSARASTGQRYALAGTSGDWTAIWYLGQKAWFYNPPDEPTAIPATGPLVTPRHDKVKVYGRAYPERSAYRRTGVKYQPQVPLQYRLRAGQRYSLGLTIPSSFQSAKTFNPRKHVTVRGKLRYYQIQLGHRAMFVKTRDVRVLH